MGTDIHLYVEVKNGADIPRWRCLPSPERDLAKWPRIPREGDGYVSPIWGPDGCMFEGSKCYGGVNDDGDETGCAGASCPACFGTGRSTKWYSNRNYDAFAILADVRNGRGFAGCDTGDGFSTIAAPRGVPEDVSAHVRDHNSWDHTPSWLLLSEILAFDWSRTTRHWGVIPFSDEDTLGRGLVGRGEEENFVSWRKRGGGRPKSWSGGVSGPRIITLSEPEAGSTAFFRAPGQRIYVTVSWTETYEESASDFLAFVREFLVPLGPPESVRIVFGFDS